MESTGLKLKNTFESLKIDDSDLAVMASKLIIQQAFSRTYNPLFLHGDSESTRTHLLHAIGNEFTRVYPKKAVIYTTGKKLLADLKKLSPAECFQKYHRYSAMLIDGVDRIVLDDKLVETFILLLEKMYSRNSQIVFTADNDEKILQVVARRVMRDRFAGGMMVAIHNS